MSRETRIARDMAAALSMMLIGAAAGGAVAQEPPSDPRTLCFNGAPLPRCSTFLVVELQGVLPVLRNARRVGTSFSDNQVTPFQDRVQWEIGLVHNVSERWAVGGAVRLGAGSTGALTGLTVRGRRWLAHDLALDVSSGATFVASSTPTRYGRETGFLADARLNFQDDVYAGVRFEQLPHVDAVVDPGGAFDEGGDPRALSLLVGLGSEWAAGGSALIAAALFLLIASVDWQ